MLCNTKFTRDFPVIDDDKLVVFDFGNGDDDLVDSIDINGAFSTLPIQKDIILDATGDQGAVTLSFVDQLFVQVPEPSSVVLLTLGLVCLAGIRRRTV